MTADHLFGPAPPGRLCSPPELHLFAGPYLVLEGRRRELPEGSKRLLVYVALHGGRVDRRAAAGTLWPMGDDARAAGNLRSALWRLRGAGIDLVEATPCSLRLRPGTVVDVDVASAWAARLTAGRASEDDLDARTWRSVELDLLPGWDEDWVVFERERLRQRSLHGLESLSRLLVLAGRADEAVEVAAATVAADPLRESAQRVLVEAHLARGEVTEALRRYDLFRTIVFRRLQVRPSAQLTAIVAGQSRSGRSDGGTPADPAAGVRAVLDRAR
jgi:DNA-binding SARP family transcriptional activator